MDLGEKFFFSYVKFFRTICPIGDDHFNHGVVMKYVCLFTLCFSLSAFGYHSSTVGNQPVKEEIGPRAPASVKK